MNMKESIERFNEQFAWKPTIEHKDKLPQCKRFILCGMGGSALAGDLIKIWKPELSLVVHRDYGLPALPEQDLRESLVIVSSYSGMTEEAISAFDAVCEQELPVVAISTGGDLIDKAKAAGVPYIELPNWGMQPRMALGLSTLAVLAVMGIADAEHELKELSTTIIANDFEEKGKALAVSLQNRTPLIYASTRNQPLAYVWKIALNETGKIPAFANRLPEVNHNEMTSFDHAKSTEILSTNYTAVFLRDPSDHERIQKRMTITADIYHEKGMGVELVDLVGSTWQKIWSTVLIGMWTAYCLAEYYGVDPEAVPLVEEFKKRIVP